MNIKPFVDRYYKHLLFFLVCLGLVTASGLFYFQQTLHTPLRIPATGIYYHLKPGTSTHHLAQDLYQQKYIKHPELFKLYARWRGMEKSLRAGEYFFPRGINSAQLINQLVKGTVVQHAITFIEGWTFKQYLKALDDAPNIVHTLKGLTPKQVMKKMGYTKVHPEGLFFPDTYYFTKGETDLTILKRAFLQMHRLLLSSWDRRAKDLPIKTPYQGLILASIIEKETSVFSELPLVSSVFTQRLKRGMKLQADPTVIYGIGQQYKGNIRKKHLRSRSPYNTYIHKGLPPTPIAMPSFAALHAALHPSPKRYLYFVAKGDGTHQFSSTLASHNRAVRKYQLKKRGKKT